MSFTDEYCNLLVKQYWEKTNAKAEITLQASTWERVFDWLKSFEEAFKIDLLIALNVYGHDSYEISIYYKGL